MIPASNFRFTHNIFLIRKVIIVVSSEFIMHMIHLESLYKVYLAIMQKLGYYYKVKNRGLLGIKSIKLSLIKKYIIMMICSIVMTVNIIIIV